MQPGTRLEHYEIGEPIGEGGMGAVYAAEDTRLKRRVAIKVLPPELASDPERLARLEREAQLLAALNHPNVATVHGFGHQQIEEDGRSRPVTFLVMELIEGPSLHDRLATGPLPWREAVEIAIGIAAGLEAAHERGIVHRDLKPANVHVTDDGAVKVLDFGLAKAFEGDAASGSLELSASPTVAAATRTGMILGTASYMSPEQARGMAVDKRSDIWALGCVLFEMLAGKKAFRGETVSDILASILKEDPDFAALPPIPIRLRHLLERCLAKHPAQRTRDIGDVRLELEAARTESARAAAGDDTRPSWTWIAATAAVAVVLGVAAGYLLRGTPAPGREMRLMVSPDSVSNGADALEISPDGRWVAEAGADGIRLRAMNVDGWRLIQGTEGAVSLTFDAASSRIYYTRSAGSGALGTLYSVGLDGATPSTEMELGPGFTIVFRGLEDELMTATALPPPGGYVVRRQMPEGGLVEVARGESPEFFPIITAQVAEDRFIGWGINTDSAVAGLFLAGPDGLVNESFLPGYRTPRRLSDGRLLAVDPQGRLVSTTIDPLTGAVVVPPAIEVEGLGLASGFAGAYALSEDATLVYMSAPVTDVLAARQTLVWVDRSGETQPLSEQVGNFQSDSRVAPDGRLLALEMVGSPVISIWVHDLERDVRSALTPGQETSFPVWSPDSRELIFLWNGGEAPGLYRAPVDRSRAPELLLGNPEDGYLLPMDWSPDGSTLLYLDSTSDVRARQAERNDIWLLPLDGGEPRPFLATDAAETNARFSPDGRWIAYQADHSGQYEIYLRPVAGGAEYRLSANGGNSPEWNQSSGEIFFSLRREFWIVDLDVSGASPSVSAPRRLASWPEDAIQNLWHPHPDGSRFLMATFGAAAEPTERSLRAIVNWRVPPR